MVSPIGSWPCHAAQKKALVEASFPKISLYSTVNSHRVVFASISNSHCITHLWTAEHQTSCRHHDAWCHLSSQGLPSRVNLLIVGFDQNPRSAPGNNCFDPAQWRLLETGGICGPTMQPHFGVDSRFISQGNTCCLHQSAGLQNRPEISASSQLSETLIYSVDSPFTK